MSTPKLNRKFVNDSRGITLIEVLAATAISVLIIVAATFFYTGIQGLWSHNTEKYTLDSEKKQLAGLFANRFAEAESIEIEENKISFLLKGVTHQLILSPLPDRTELALHYSYGDSEGITLPISEHIEYIQVNGMDLTIWPANTAVSPGDLIKFEFGFKYRSTHDTLISHIKLLHTGITGQ